MRKKLAIGCFLSKKYVLWSVTWKGADHLKIRTNNRPLKQRGVTCHTMRDFIPIIDLKRHKMYAACIAGSIRTISHAWPSFLNFVEPHVDEIFMNVADNISCARDFKGHPKISSYQITNNFDKTHSSESIESQKQHDVRDKGCLDMVSASNRTFDLVLLTRPDIVYAEAFPFTHLPSYHNVLYIPYGDDHGGLNDQMKVGTLQTLFKHSGWSKYVLSSNVPGPERSLAKQITNHRINVKRFWYEYALLRKRDESLATAVGLTLFAQHNHNTRIWNRLDLNPAFGSIIDTNTTCTVTDGHVKLPNNVPCIRKHIAFTCNRSSLTEEQLEKVICSEKPPREEAKAALCNQYNFRPQMQRELASKACARLRCR